MIRWIAVAAAVATLSGCAGKASEPVSVGYGANPELPAPETSFLPAMKIATAVGWPEGSRPMAAPGLEVVAFASGLDHPRWLHVLPNGDVLVAESNAPPRPEGNKGVKAFFMKQAMKKAGAAVPSANRITILRDETGDGRADKRETFLDGLNSPFGMGMANGRLFVANTDGVVSYPYRPDVVRITDAPQTVADLPAGPRNHHWTKNILLSPDGTKIYATVGSNSNIAENGMEEEEGRGAIWEIDVASGDKRVFASGLRNPNGLAWNPTSGELWTAVNERDELGHNLAPDYITSVKDGAFYGWPWSYFGQTVDTRVKPARPDMVAKAIAPDYAVGAHTASLGLTFAPGDGAGQTRGLGEAFQNGAFIGQHGSWNRNPPSGYKVIFVPFANGRPAGVPVDVLTGFLSEDEKEAFGRPVGVAFARDGALLVADDVGNVVWRVSAAGNSQAAETSTPAQSALSR